MSTSIKKWLLHRWGDKNLLSPLILDNWISAHLLLSFCCPKGRATRANTRTSQPTRAVRGLQDSDRTAQSVTKATTGRGDNDTYVQPQVERWSGSRAVSRRNQWGHLCEIHTGVRVPWVQMHGRKVCSLCLGALRTNTSRKETIDTKTNPKAIVMHKKQNDSLFLLIRSATWEKSKETRFIIQT